MPSCSVAKSQIIVRTTRKKERKKDRKKERKKKNNSTKQDNKINLAAYAYAKTTKGVFLARQINMYCILQSTIG